MPSHVPGFVPEALRAAVRAGVILCGLKRLDVAAPRLRGRSIDDLHRRKLVHEALSVQRCLFKIPTVSCSSKKAVFRFHRVFANIRISTTRTKGQTVHRLFDGEAEHG